MIAVVSISYLGALHYLYHSQQPRGQKLKIALTYTRIIFLFLIYHYFGLRVKRIKFLGFKMELNNFLEFYSLFSLIFVYRVYYFESPNHKPLIFDAGANTGISILFFKSLYPESVIYGFEPAPESFSLLQRNVEANSLSGVFLYPYALLDQEQELELYVPEDRPACPGVTMYPENLPATMKLKKIKVKAQPLSLYLNQPVDLLKMDIEGAEDMVIRELAEKGKLKLVKQIIMEYHHHTEPEKEKLADFLKLLELNGFGYQLHSYYLPLHHKMGKQGILIYAYQK